MFSFCKDVPPYNTELIKQGIYIFHIRPYVALDMSKVRSFNVKYTESETKYILNEERVISEKAFWTTEKFVNSVSRDYLYKHAQNFMVVHTEGRRKENYTTKQNKFVKKNKLKKDDIVMIHKPDTYSGWNNRWLPEMNDVFIGSVHRISTKSNYGIEVHSKFRGCELPWDYPYTAIRKLNPTRYEHDRILIYAYHKAQNIKEFWEIVNKLKTQKRKKEPYIQIHMNNIIDYDSTAAVFLKVDIFNLDKTNLFINNPNKAMSAITEFIANLN